MSKHHSPELSEVKTDVEELEARVDALEAHLTLPHDKAAARLENARQRLEAALSQVKTEVERQKAHGEEWRQEVAGSVDHLKVQLALAQADARDGLEKERAAFDRDVATLDHDITQHMAHLEDSIVASYRKARDRFKAELDAAVIRGREERAHTGAAFNQRKIELLAELQGWKENIEASRRQRSQKLEQFRQDVAPDLHHIAESWSRLLH